MELNNTQTSRLVWELFCEQNRMNDCFMCVMHVYLNILLASEILLASVNT